MRTFLLGLMALCMIPAGLAVAAEQSSDTQTQCAAPAQHGQDDVNILEQFLDSRDGAEANGARSYWHCEAFAHDDFHHMDPHHGYGYYQQQAYYNAMQSCQYYHHYCHAHCHINHH